MSSADLQYFRDQFIHAAGSAFPVESPVDESAAAGMFDAALRLPPDAFMRQLLELIRNAEQAPSNRVQPAVSLVTSLAEARHLVGAA